MAGIIVKLFDMVKGEKMVKGDLNGHVVGYL
jgi:hypothetical protein